MCRRLPCLLCVEVFSHLQCLPGAVTYAVYIAGIIMFATAVLYVKSAVKAIWTSCRAIYFITRQGCRAIKGIARLSMLSGAHVGRKLRESAARVNIVLENANLPQNATQAIVLLALISCIQEVAACNNHMVISSSAKNCVGGSEEETCEMTEQMQVTLENLEYQQCLWFKDESSQNLFSLKLKLTNVGCVWQTQRKYFTFPVVLKTVSQVSCPASDECGWGKHCVRDRPFPAQTKESESWPGISRCIAVDSGSSYCWIIDSQPCMFYRAYLVPDYMKTYEVRSLHGYSCNYAIEIIEQGNATAEEAIVRHTAVTTRGIRITVQGAFDQPTQIMNSMFIARVGNAKEAYLDHASPAGRPRAATIGDIQANASLTKNFIFDPKSIECDIYEENLLCHQQESYLQTLTDTKNSALPKAIGYHLFSIDAHERLKSELLHTNPVNIHLSFEKYKFTIERRTVCPRFANDQLIIEGCFACAPLAKIKLEVFSTCSPGPVAVHFEVIQVATRSLTLSTTPASHVIQFRSESRCIDDKLCLAGRTVQMCKPFHICLDNAQIELVHPNMTAQYASTGAFQAPYGINWSYLHSWLTGASLTKLWIGISLVVIILLFLISAVITCCRG